MSDHALPAPRLQLRWAIATETDLEGTTYGSIDPKSRHRCWACHYELVIPLQKGDVRRGPPDEPNADVLIIPMGTTVSGSTYEPDGPPYRDGHHAQFDSVALGKLPVYHVASDGRFRLQIEPE
jgi:hypothetical protein